MSSPPPSSIESVQRAEGNRLDRVLFVDFDGTLIAGDLLWECFVASLKSDLRNLWRVPIWLGQGRANLKLRLALCALPDATLLPYRQEVIALLERRKKEGWRLVLATASHANAIEHVVDHLRLFDDAIATNATENMKGPLKLKAIKQYCEDHQFSEFSYIGDSKSDLVVWGAASEAIVVAPSSALAKRLAEISKNVQVLAPRQPWAAVFLRAMRPHHWAKNALLFVPLIFAHQLFAVDKLLACSLGFAIFCATASAIYLLNDVFDVESDRRHPVKRSRPFAAGTLPMWQGFAGGGGLLLAALAASLALPRSFTLILLVYILSNMLYSLWLKRKVMIDILFLASLFTWRIVAGGAATGIELSEWLLAFAMFFFLSLAFVKRYAELHRLRQEGTAGTPGRGYYAEDLALMRSMGATSGYLAVLVAALYLNTDRVRQLYAHPDRLWLACPILLFWISRLWLWANRGAIPEDPLSFALKDKTSWYVAAALAVILLLSQ